MVAQEISRGSEDGFPFPNLGMPELVHTGEVGGRGREGARRCLGGSKRLGPCWRIRQRLEEKLKE